MPVTCPTTPEAPRSAPAAPRAGIAESGITLTPEVIVEVAPAEVMTLDKLIERDASRIWQRHPGRDVVPILHQFQGAVCEHAADAAAVLADPKSSPDERQAAGAVMQEFIEGHLRYDDVAIQRRYDRRLVKRVGPFVGEPLWTATIKELLVGNWRGCTYGWPLFYLRAAINRIAYRWYRDQVGDLRRCAAYGDWLDDRPMSALDRRDVLGTRREEKEGTRGAARAGQPIHKHEDPLVFRRLDVELDLKKLLAVAGATGDAATLLTHGVLEGASGADIAAQEGWSDTRLEAAQARWRQTLLPRMEAACIAGLYEPTPPKQEWKKFRESRAAISAKRSQDRPYRVDARAE